MSYSRQAEQIKIHQTFNPHQLDILKTESISIKTNLIHFSLSTFGKRQNYNDCTQSTPHLFLFLSG